MFSSPWAESPQLKLQKGLLDPEREREGNRHTVLQKKLLIYLCKFCSIEISGDNHFGSGLNFSFRQLLTEVLFPWCRAYFCFAKLTCVAWTFPRKFAVNKVYSWSFPCLFRDFTSYWEGTITSIILRVYF